MKVRTKAKAKLMSRNVKKKLSNAWYNLDKVAFANWLEGNKVINKVHP